MVLRFKLRTDEEIDQTGLRTFCEMNIYVVLNVKIMFWMKYMKLCLEPYLSIIPGLFHVNFFSSIDAEI